MNLKRERFLYKREKNLLTIKEDGTTESQKNKLIQNIKTRGM